ncbi:hypothetical protein AO072_05420 [Pseudomonas syringae ICMP 13102]|uniref:hypothetical protein n=1 Tax=Pseudomonas syringae TaxID=317 RepID=UPI0007304EE9|nr:hypothetical protein [Pseudomonas syringae]KTB75771.1 hypothetical protein AO072_05420 [Pseudomonas syringae ICMP 13102]
MAKQRSPSYPGITLETALARAKAFYRAEDRHETVVATAVGHWKYGPKSSGGLVTISALKSYGLMDDKGVGVDRKVRLSQLGLSIAQDDRLVSPERDEAIKKAALNPPILRDLWERYGLNLPSTDTVAHYLRVEKLFIPAAALDLIKIYKEVVSYAKLGANDSSSESPDSIFEDEIIDEEEVDSPVSDLPRNPNVAASVERPTAYLPQVVGEEIANIRVSRSTTIRLTANGPYSKKSMEALVAQLKLGLDLGTYDDLPSEDEDF